MIADWRPDRRIVDPDLMRILKLRWDECCLCGVTNDLHIHHIVYRSQSGDDIEANCCCLCIGCHTSIHSRDPEKWAQLAVHIVAERSDVVEYLHHKVGRRAFLYLEGLPEQDTTG